MKKRGLYLLVISLFTVGGYTVINNTGEDIVLESGVMLSSESITEHFQKTYPKRSDTEACFKIIVHHTNLPKNYSIDKLSASHVEKGWPRLSYHFAVLDDKIYIINDINKMTWHAKGSNAHGIGLVMLGSYQKEAPSEETIHTLKALISGIKSAYCVESVLGHRDVRATLCPGDAAYQVLIEEGIIEL
jgi:N-acetyl-anhydromuramyl-L-alanine amidase AmpD